MKCKKERSTLEAFFENALWNSRWAVIVSVVCSIVSSIMMFYVAAVDTFFIIDMLIDYAAVDDAAVRQAHRGDAIAHIVEVIDVFLLAIVLMIFGLGLYELYISKIDHAYDDNDESAEHMLSINSLDDLKSRLGKVIMMILIVKFFEMAIGMQVTEVFDLFIFAGGIILIALALYITSAASRHTGEWKTRKSDRAGSSNERVSD